MKKIIILALCAALTISLSACSNDKPAQNSSSSSVSDNAQVPNPYTEYETLDAAAEKAGFKMTAPDSIDGYDDPIIQVMNKTMIQLIYKNAENNSIQIRKAAGSEDISGDFNSYPETSSAEIGGADVAFKGSDSLVSLATWTNDGYTYSVRSDLALTIEAMTALVESVN